MSHTEGLMAAAIVTATIFNASIIVAATTPNHIKRAEEVCDDDESSTDLSFAPSAKEDKDTTDKHQDKDYNDTVQSINIDDTKDEILLKCDSSNSSAEVIGGDQESPCLLLVEKTDEVSEHHRTPAVVTDETEEKRSAGEENERIQHSQPGIEGIMAAAIVTATTSATSIMIACTTPDRKTRRREEVSRQQESLKEDEAIEKVIVGEEMEWQDTSAGRREEKEEENDKEEEEEEGAEEDVDVDDMSAVSQHSTERDLAASIVLSTTSATCIMLAAVNNTISSNNKAINSHALDTGSHDGDSQHTHPHSHPESTTSSVYSILPPLPTEQLWQNTHTPDEEEDLPESSRQSETTHNKFMAVDVLSHKSAWLFHLIDRNSDASLTLAEFIAALADQPLVSMALDLPQQMKAEGSLEKVEKIFDFMDYNSSGTINMQKFLQYVDNLRRDESLQLIRDAKKKLDAMRASVQQVDSRPSSAKDSPAFRVDYAVAMAGNRRLNLTSRCIRDRDVEAIADNLANNMMLRFLVLGRNCIGIDGVSRISTALRSNTTLTRLDLGSNKCGNEGVILLAETLCSNSTLQRLDLYNTPMDESGARAIAKALMVNKTLRELSLRGNHMGNAGAMLIGEALRYNTVLTCLFLQENDIDPVPGQRGFVTSLYSCDNFVLERLGGIDLAAFSRILDINPDPAGLSNEKILAMMRSRRGLHVSKRILNK